jgi:DNA-binding FrmR family transcriptional regulator
MASHYSKALDNRLAGVEGHVAAIRRMLAENRPCEDILTQLSAAESALSKAARMLMKDHLNHCVLDAVAAGDSDALTRFSAILDQFL